MATTLKASGFDLVARKVRRNLRDYGVWQTAKKAFAAVGSLVFERRTYRLYRIDLEHAPNAIREVDGIHFRLVDARDQAAIEQIEDFSEWLEGSLQQRISRGDLCLCAFDGDRLAGFNLISFGEIYMPLVHLRKEFPSDCAWSEQIAVVSDYRKGGLGGQLRYRIFQELRARGYRKLYGGALSDNVASLALARRVGFQEFVDITYTRALRAERWVYKRVKP